jgi:two-component system, OmpR family, sensor kinase
VPIRWRLTLVVTAATILLAGLAGLVGTRGLRASVLDSIDRDLARRAAPITRELTDEGDEDHPGVDMEDLAKEISASPDSFAQVLDPAGRVLVASPGLPNQSLVAPSALRGVTSRPVGFEERLGGPGGERVRVLAVPVNRPDGRYVVAVGGSLATAQAALDRVRTGLVAGGAGVVVLGSLGAWLLAGAALRPVERLRAAVAAVPPDHPHQDLEVPRTRDELARLARTMNQLLGRISQALERERRLIADASHELRSPLTVLRTELELADQPGRSQAELADSVHHAAAEANRIARLAEDLLFLARTDQGGPTVHPTRQPLQPVLADAVAAAAGRAAANQVRVDLDVEGGLAAPVDADRVRQAVDNLLDNALRVAPAGSTIQVHAGRRDGRVVVEVADVGPGFPAAFLPHAFERFRRADTARTRSDGGSGLGLAIVAAIARGHGGTAEAANRPGGGAAVRLVLPSS